MIIDTQLIKEEIFKGTAPEASKRLGIPVKTINAYRAKESVKGYRNWKGLSIEKAEQIMQIINEKE